MPYAVKVRCSGSAPKWPPPPPPPGGPSRPAPRPVGRPPAQQAPPSAPPTAHPQGDATRYLVREPHGEPRTPRGGGGGAGHAPATAALSTTDLQGARVLLLDVVPELYRMYYGAARARGGSSSALAAAEGDAPSLSEALRVDNPAAAAALSPPARRADAEEADSGIIIIRDDGDNASGGSTGASSLTPVQRSLGAALLRSIGALLRGTPPPTHVVAVMDPLVDCKTSRHVMHPEYKSGRRATPAELKAFQPHLPQLLSQAGILSVEVPATEADDIIGSLAKLAEAGGAESVTIVSPDKDFYQLLSGVTRILRRRRDGSGRSGGSRSAARHSAPDDGGGDQTDSDEDAARDGPPAVAAAAASTADRGAAALQPFTAEEFCAQFGLPSPALWLDVCALKGDPSDNIPGVAGVGEKTAIKLVQKLGSLAAVLEQAPQEATPLRGVRPSARALLASPEGRAAAQFSADLIRIDTSLKSVQAFDFSRAAVGADTLQRVEVAVAPLAAAVSKYRSQ